MRDNDDCEIFWEKSFLKMLLAMLGFYKDKYTSGVLELVQDGGQKT